MTTRDTYGSASGLVRFASDVVVRRVGDDAIALKLSTETAYSLNDSAARIALLIEGGAPLPSIAAQLAAEYDQPLNVITKQIDDLVDALVAKGLIVTDAPDPT